MALVQTTVGLVDEGILERRVIESEDDASIVTAHEWYLLADVGDAKAGTLVRRDGLVNMKAGVTVGSESGVI